MKPAAQFCVQGEDLVLNTGLVAFSAALNVGWCGLLPGVHAFAESEGELFKADPALSHELTER